MAKFKYFKPRKTNNPKTTRINSIVGEEYLKDYKQRLSKASQLASEQHRTSVSARDIFIGTKVDKDKLDNENGSKDS